MRQYTKFQRVFTHLLEQSGRSPYKVAQLGGLRPEQVYRYQSGEKRPSPYTLCKVVLGMVADEDLLTGKPDLFTALEQLIRALLDEDISDF